MPVIETARSDILALKGLHLFHFATSNCSQRVRLVLEEKRLRWTSHHIDLTKFENARPSFIALNPHGVVPVLVHDGATVVESNDIIHYLDDLVPEPSLTPCHSGGRSYVTLSMQRSAGFQSSLKLLMHEFLFKPFRRMDRRQLEEYRTGTQRPELAGFMQEFSSPQGFGRARILQAVEEASDAMSELESRLERCAWLSGQGYGLADISWIVNLHRFDQMHYPMQRYPRLADWIARMQGRPAYKLAVQDYDSKKMRAIFNVYTVMRRLRGTSIRSYLA